MGEAAAPLLKSSQRHSTLRGMDAHHVLRALKPKPATCEQRPHLLRNVHNCNNTTPSLLQTEPASLLLIEPETGRWPTPNARKNRTECVSVQGASAYGNRPAGLGKKERGRVEYADGNWPVTLEKRESGRAPQPGDRASLTGKKPAGI